MDIHIDIAGFALSKQLKKYLDSLITAESTGKNSVIIKFRDKSYSATKGGYHPVEISIAADEKVQYITDFAYYGMGDYAELCKELDFDFADKTFQTVHGAFDIRDGQKIFKLWQKNFITYCIDWQVFDDINVQTIEG